jgi:hypothetical protein
MIDISKQIELLKRRFHGEKVQYVIVPTMTNGVLVMGIAKGKCFNSAMYKDNFNFRRAK